MFSVNRISFYEQGNPNPLSPSFKGAVITTKEISDIIHTGLFAQIIASTKVKKPFEFMQIIIIIVVVGVIGLILISKLMGQ